MNVCLIHIFSFQQDFCFILAFLLLFVPLIQMFSWTDWIVSSLHSLHPHMPNVISPLSHIILETIQYAYFLYIELCTYLLVIYQGVSFSCPVPTLDYFSLKYKIKYLIVFDQNVLNGLFCCIFISSWKKCSCH